MNRKSTEVTKDPKSVSDRANILALGVLAFFSFCHYGIVTWLSPSFEYYQPNTQRPLLLVLALFGGLFFLYLLAIRFAARANQDKQLIWMVVGSAVIFRVIVLFSTPIQEVDIYRYVWDGIVCAQVISPFRFPPAQVNAAVETEGFAFGNGDRDLRTLVKLAKKNPAIRETLKRVHFGRLPTVYPPVSQAVFAMAALTTPDDSSLTTRLRLMKVWLIGFDLATLFLVIKLLSLCRLPVGLSLIYAWCPLLMKEIANSGHLDTIAVFLTTLFVYGLVRLLKRTSEVGNLDGGREISKRGLTRSLALLGFVLATAVGAKLYPIVLMPLFFLFVFSRFGWRNLIVPGFVFSISTLIFIWPMLPSGTEVSLNSAPRSEQNVLANHKQVVGRSDPSLGIQEFLKTWEINDLIFMVIVENLKPAEQHPGNRHVWFSVFPDQMRESTIDFTESSLESIFKSQANGKPPVFQKYQLPFFVTPIGDHGVFSLPLYRNWFEAVETRRQ